MSSGLRAVKDSDLSGDGHLQRYQTKEEEEEEEEEVLTFKVIWGVSENGVYTPPNCSSTRENDWS